MKRTLLALALLLGTGGAFAQIGIKADAIQRTQVRNLDKMMISQTIKSQKQTVENGRKDVEMTLLTDFSDESTYTFGTGSRNAVVGYGFNLQPNATDLFGATGDRLNTFMGLIDAQGNVVDDHWWWTSENWQSYWQIPNVGHSANNGYAYVSMLDIMQNGANIRDLEITITLTTPIESGVLRGVDLYFNQFVYKFNADRYFIDWSNDENFATYDSIEFNVRGIETEVNEMYPGTKRVTLPNNTANASAVAPEGQFTYVRLRLYSPANTQQPHGYFWFVDDIYYANVPENRVDVLRSDYLANGYHLIPAGLQLDTLVNYSYVENTGAQDYYAAKVENIINKMNVEPGAEGEDPIISYTFVAKNESEADTLRNTMTIVEELNDAGVVVSTTQQRYNEVYAWTTPLPSTEVGTYTISSQITDNGSVVQVLDDTTTFDVVEPMLGYETYYRWAKDRDRLVERGIFRAGYIQEGSSIYVTGEDAAYGIEGYEVCLPYATIGGEYDTQRWIKGVEVVPAMDSCLAGTRIQGKLRMVNPQLTTLDDYIIDVEDENGVPVVTPVYEVAAHDLNNGLATDPDFLDVIGPDEFKTIYMQFPTSVKLEPGNVYYACYRMASTGKFAVGTDNPQLGTFGPGSGYYWSMMLVCQPNVPGANYAWGGSFFFPDYAGGVCPMIRMVVGTSEASLPESISVASSLNLFPNPANNEASISYTLNKSGNVTIVITDIMGRTVKTMNQGNQVAGANYNVNLSTSDLANGTYFYTMNVNGEKQTKKFVVNR